MGNLTSQSHIVVVHQPVNSLQLSTDIELLHSLVQELDRRVFGIATKDELSLLLLVRAVDVFNGEDGKVAVVTEVAESDAGGWLDAEFVDRGLGDVEADGHREEVAVSETVVLDDAGGGGVLAEIVPGVHIDTGYG